MASTIDEDLGYRYALCEYDLLHASVILILNERFFNQILALPDVIHV